MTDPLTRLAIIHGTDKFGYHDYMPKYFRLFERFRDRPVKLLEIGVGGYQDADRGGESLEVWRDFFPEGRIVGIDIQQKDMDLGERVTILQGSQVDADFLADVVREHGPFDLIVDDGSHRNEHVVDSFGLLFPTMAPGGLYVVEDVQTAFFPRFGGSLDLMAPNTVGHFRDIAGDLSKANAHGIRQITRFHNMIAVEKQAEDRPDIATGWLAGRVGKGKRLLEIGLGTLPKGVSDSLQAGDLVQFHPKGKPGWPQESDIKALKKLAKKHGPFDAVIDHDGSADIVAELFPSLSVGGLWYADNGLAGWMTEMFVAIDHREIRVNFPDALLPDEARETYALMVSPHSAAVEKAANDYPSNFAFEYRHPEALAAFAEIEAVLDEAGRERGLLLFADIMTRAGDNARSRKMLARLTEIGAKSRSYFNMAVREARLTDQWDKARDMLLEAVALYPDDARMIALLGSVHSKAREWPEAVSAFRKAVELSPRDATCRVQLANALSQTGDIEAAVKIAVEATSLAPDHAGHHVQLGRLQCNAGQHSAAVRTLRRALRINPETPNAHRQLSRALEALGDREAALEVAAQATDLFPDNQEYRRWHERLDVA